MLKSDHPIPSEMYESGKLLVQFHPHVSPHDRLNTHTLIGTTLIQQIPELNVDVVAVEDGKEMEYRNKYLSSDYVKNVELNYYLFQDFKPNDPFYWKKIQTSQGCQRQWGLRRINPKPAWDITHKLSPTVKIAIIDWGIDPNHPDLADKIVDPINFSTSDPNDYIDRIGHGTAMAGIAAAITNNKTGIAGTSFNTAYIMPIKIGDTGQATLIAQLNGIIYAINKGAKVINMSFGSHDYSVLLQNALNLAWDNGIVCVAAAGNDGREQLSYPAGNNYVLAVSATDKSNSLMYFSNWGLDIGVAAPGKDILSTSPTYPVPNKLPNYDAGSGTSRSAPFVSGVAAMMFAVNPSLTNQEVIQIIQQTARPIDREEDDDDWICDKHKAWNPFFGYGLLNAGKAVKLAKKYHKSHKREKGLGSFYGQVIDKQTGLPIANATVYAVSRKGKSKKQYMTKTNVSVVSIPDLGTDGMFRLMNLPKKTYAIFVILPGQSPQPVQLAKIVPGADTFLRLLV